MHVREDRVEAGGDRQAPSSGRQAPTASYGRPQTGRGRCYVGNLAYSVGWQDLKDLFRSAGRVIHADVMLEENGRSKGYGTVEFETEEEVGWLSRHGGTSSRRCCACVPGGAAALGG